jgi:hypothetical protein
MIEIKYDNNNEDYYPIIVAKDSNLQLPLFAIIINKYSKMARSKIRSSRDSKGIN